MYLLWRPSRLTAPFSWALSAVGRKATDCHAAIRQQHDKGMGGWPAEAFNSPFARPLSRSLSREGSGKERAFASLARTSDSSLSPAGSNRVIPLPSSQSSPLGSGTLRRVSESALRGQGDTLQSPQHSGFMERRSLGTLASQQSSFLDRLTSISGSGLTPQASTRFDRSATAQHHSIIACKQLKIQGDWSLPPLQMLHHERSVITALCMRGCHAM